VTVAVMKRLTVGLIRTVNTIDYLLPKLISGYKISREAYELLH
jgi:hypothetical protein